jgi:hypothetical protein
LICIKTRRAARAENCTHYAAEGSRRPTGRGEHHEGLIVFQVQNPRRDGQSGAIVFEPLSGAASRTGPAARGSTGSGHAATGAPSTTTCHGNVFQARESGTVAPPASH